MPERAQPGGQRRVSALSLARPIALVLNAAQAETFGYLYNA